MAALPMYFPEGFTLTTSVFCASLVNSAYDQYTQWYDQDYPNMPNFVWTQPDITGYTFSAPLYWSYTWLDVDYQEPIGFVAWTNGVAYVVFRGTSSDADSYYDGKVDQVEYGLAADYGNVHEGFYEIYSQLSSQILSILSSVNTESTLDQVVFTGHSLGSGLSSLAVPDVITNGGLASSVSYLHINLASPRVGDLTYAAAMNASSVPTFRVVNTEDIVPTAPLACDTGGFYQHIGTPVDFTANYLSFDANHSLTGAYIYALGNPQSPESPSTTDMLVQRSAGPKPIGQRSDGHVGIAARAAAAQTAVSRAVPGDKLAPKK